MAVDPHVAIVDYGLGNLCSVQLACAHAGLPAIITSEPTKIAAADGIILPGVGAFSDAMAELRKTGAADAVTRAVEAGRPFFGICLGLQLLMTESLEFGRHEGLCLIPGRVLPIPGDLGPNGRRKVPHVGWARLTRPAPDAWAGTPLDGELDGTHMYFVHSFYVAPDDLAVVVATTEYEGLEFVSAVRRKNVFACQCHPERSGPDGLRVYRQFARLVSTGQPIVL